MEHHRERLRRFLPRKDLVTSVPAAWSKLRRRIKKGRLEDTRPAGLTGERTFLSRLTGAKKHPVKHGVFRGVLEAAEDTGLEPATP